MGAKKKDDSKKKQENPEAKVEERVKAIEAEKNDLNVHLTFLQKKLGDVQSHRSQSLESLSLAEDTVKKIEEDYEDILRHRESEMKINKEKTIQLDEKVEELKSELKGKQQTIRELEETNARQKTTLEDCRCLLEDKQQLEQLVKAQCALIEKQTKEMDELVSRKTQLETELGQRDKELAALQVQVEDAAELKILFDEICFVRQRNRITSGNVPADRSCAALCSAAGNLVQTFRVVSEILGGEKLVFVGGEQGGSVLAVLDLQSLTWTQQELPLQPFHTLHSHSACPLGRAKVITYGGIKNGVNSTNTVVLNTETMKWQSLDLSRMVSPAARTQHASCTSRDRLFIFGGMVQEELSDQLWMLDLETLEWKHLIGYGDEPSPRFGSSMCVSEDGRKLYLFGGNDGSYPLNDFHFFDIEKQVWSLTTALNSSPEGRQFHVSSVSGHCLLIAGGLTRNKENDGLVQLGNVYALDLISLRWEVLDDGSWVSNFPWMKPRGSYMALNGNQLIVLKPDRDEKLSQVGIFDFLLPEEIIQMRSLKKKETNHRTILDFTSDLCSTNSIEIEWAPPTKNADRIDHFKLMLATLSGTVQDVYQGKEQQYRITGLRPNAEYILCLKAIYDDGSYIWSDSKSYRTKSTARSGLN